MTQNGKKNCLNFATFCFGICLNEYNRNDSKWEEKLFKFCHFLIGICQNEYKRIFQVKVNRHDSKWEEKLFKFCHFLFWNLSK